MPICCRTSCVRITPSGEYTAPQIATLSASLESQRVLHLRYRMPDPHSCSSSLQSTHSSRFCATFWARLDYELSLRSLFLVRYDAWWVAFCTAPIVITRICTDRNIYLDTALFGLSLRKHPTRITRQITANIYPHILLYLCRKTKPPADLRSGPGFKLYNTRQTDRTQMVSERLLSASEMIELMSKWLCFLRQNIAQIHIQELFTFCRSLLKCYFSWPITGSCTVHVNTKSTFSVKGNIISIWAHVTCIAQCSVARLNIYIN